MPSDTFVAVVVAGNAEHGKTTVVRCLSAVQASVPGVPYSQTRSNGMSSPPFQVSSGMRMALVDLPCDSTLLRNAWEAWNGFDVGVLVVAADEGVMPGTREHLELLSRFDVRGGCILITKSDLVDRETIELAQIEIQETIQGSCLDGKPIIPFSASDLRALPHIVSVLKDESERVGGRPYTTTNHCKALKKRVLHVATDILTHNVFKVAVSRDELLARLEPTPDEPLLKVILRELCAEGRLVAINSGYRIPTLAIKLPHNRAKFAEQMLEYAKNLGYATFNARTFCEQHWKSFNYGEIRELLEYLRERKQLVRLNDGRYLTAEAVDDIKGKVMQWITTKGQLTVQDSWEILGYGRNRAIPVFEYLDSIGLTIRTDECRVLRSDASRTANPGRTHAW